MHDRQVKERFIELRIEGKSLRGIAQELKISKNTACEWNIEFGSRIVEAQRMALEAAMEEYLAGPVARAQNIASIYAELYAGIVKKREDQVYARSTYYSVNFEPLLKLDAHLRKIMPPVPKSPRHALPDSDNTDPSNPT